MHPPYKNIDISSLYQYCVYLCRYCWGNKQWLTALSCWWPLLSGLRGVQHCQYRQYCLSHRARITIITALYRKSKHDRVSLYSMCTRMQYLPRRMLQCSIYKHTEKHSYKNKCNVHLVIYHNILWKYIIFLVESNTMCIQVQNIYIYVLFQPIPLTKW